MNRALTECPCEIEGEACPTCLLRLCHEEVIQVSDNYSQEEPEMAKCKKPKGGKK